MTSRGTDPTEMWGAFATPPELGWALLNAFRNSIPLGEPLPSWVEQRCSPEAADGGNAATSAACPRSNSALMSGQCTSPVSELSASHDPPADAGSRVRNEFEVENQAIQPGLGGGCDTDSVANPNDRNSKFASERDRLSDNAALAVDRRSPWL